MRMHSYSKCSPNLVVGALSIFTLIVLYNYWNISTYNRDLVLKLHSLEQQVVSFSRANEGLSSNLEKLQDDKAKLQTSLQREEIQGKDSRDVLQQKEKIIKDTQNDLELSKQELQICVDKTSTLEAKELSRDKEVSELKEKIVSLEAQVVEKTSYNEKVETELSEAKVKIEHLQKTLANKPTAAAAVASKSTAASVGAKPVPQPEELAQEQQQQPLLNDPAEREVPKVAAPLEQPKKLPEADGEAAKDAAIENDGGGDGAGVLPVPGQNQDALQPIKESNPNPQQVPQPPQGGNLDAAEDDGDRKDDQLQQDDQSPDGALPLSNKEKESAAVMPVPLVKQQDIVAAPLPHSGQDVREAAHLNNQL